MDLRTRTAVVTALGLLLAAPFALASGGGPVTSPQIPPAAQTPEDQAHDAYNAGVRQIHKADDAMADAAKATDPARLQKAQDRAREYFGNAQKQFEHATDLVPGFYQAWNYVGYCKRNRGDFTGALAAYDRALSLNPGYAEAIEYRAHAYLGLQRIGDAKDAYLALFAADRKLAGKLLAAMKSWVSGQRAAPSAAAATGLDEFSQWIDERGRIAAQTAGLAPQGAGARWP